MSSSAGIESAQAADKEGQETNPPPKLSCVFLDRDGVLNTHLPDAYVRSPAELVILPGAASAVRKLNDAGIKAVIISNQQGVGKKLMTSADLDSVDRALRERLASEAGAHIDRSLYCPHLKEEACDCRKPLPGLIHQALEALGLAADNTAFIGDTERDMMAAKAAGVGCRILVLSGANKSYRKGQFNCEPDRVFADLSAAVDWLVGRGGTK